MANINKTNIGMEGCNETTIENLLNLLDECGPNSQISFGHDPKNVQLQERFEEFCDRVGRKKALKRDWLLLPQHLRQEHDVPSFSPVETRLLTYLESTPIISQRIANGTECRLCLSSENKLVRLVNLKKEVLDVAETLFHVSIFDGFPQLLCMECLNGLNSIVNFSNKCKSSHLKLLTQAYDELYGKERKQFNQETNDLLLLSNVSEAKSQMEESVIEIDSSFDEDVVNSGCDDKIMIKSNDTEDERHICHYCNKKFRKKFSLRVHIRTHTNQRPYSCSICNKAFKTYSAVNTHKVSHNADKKFECPVPECTYRTTTKANLNIHSRTHTQERKYSCTHCELKFTTASNLSKHVKNIHYNMKEHACSQCDKMFFTKESARKHEITHSNLKPYSCPICSLSYAWYNGLQKHMKSVHPGVKSATEKMFFDKIGIK